MFNVQNEQISDDRKNVSSLLNIEQVVEYLNYWEGLTGSGSWLVQQKYSRKIK